MSTKNKSNQSKLASHFKKRPRDAENDEAEPALEKKRKEGSGPKPLKPPLVPEDAQLEEKTGTSRVWQYFYMYKPTGAHIYCRVRSESGSPCNHIYQYAKGGVSFLFVSAS